MNKEIVNPLNSIKTGMWLIFHRDNIKQGYIMRQDAVEPEKQVETPAFFNIHVEEVLAGMNSGIGSTTAENRNALLKDAAEAVLQNFLYTQFVGLPLPAEIMGSLIADMNKISQVHYFILLS